MTLQKRQFSINGLGNIDGFTSKEEPKNIYFDFGEMQKVQQIINNNTKYSLKQNDFYFKLTNQNRTIEILLRGIVKKRPNGNLDTFFIFNGFDLINVEMINKKIRNIETKINKDSRWKFEGYIEDGELLDDMVTAIGYEKETALQILSYGLKLQEEKEVFTGFYYDEEEQGIVIEDDSVSYGYMFIAPVKIENEAGEEKEIYFIGDWGWQWCIEEAINEDIWDKK